MNEKYEIILQKIKKKYHYTDTLIEIYLENYHKHYLYIRIDYYKKLKKYKLSWIDLNHYQNNFDSIISYEYMPEDMIYYLKDLISKLDNHHFYQKPLKEKYKVKVTSNLLLKKNQPYSLIFNQFIHKEDKTLYNIFNLVFENLPFKLTCFFEELSAHFTGTTGKYELEEEFEFDLINGELSTIIDDSQRKLGEEFYQGGRVLFLEKINNEYIAIVGDTSLYAISIKYDDSTKKVQMTCACPASYSCYHFCAVVLAIRNHKFNKFYKVTPKRNNTSLLDRVMNFQYILSIGIDDQGNHFLIIENNQLKLVPILDSQGESVFEILEDDEEGTLSKRINDITSKIKL